MRQTVYVKSGQKLYSGAVGAVTIMKDVRISAG